MKEVAVLVKDWEQNQVDVLSKYGIKATTGIRHILIYDKEILNSLEPFLKEWSITPFETVEFSESDRINAPQSVISSTMWVNGYPMPDGTLAYRKINHDQSLECKGEDCRIKGPQIAPYRIKKEPDWSKKKWKAFSLNWDVNEIFVEKNTYSRVFQPLGIDCIPVIIHKSNTEAKTVVQLSIPVIDEDQNLENIPYHYCLRCQRKKYEPKLLDFYHTFQNHDNLKIWKGREYFGYGGESYQQIFVTRAIRELLNEEKITKLHLCNPCK